MEEQEEEIIMEEQEVVVIDIKMPFVSMVFFMIKWAIAAIPAAFIFFILGGAIFYGIILK